MKLYVTDQTATEISLRFEDCTIAFANTFRRILLSEIPSVAFDLISLLENTTVLADDQLVHRIGLVPIHFSKNELVYHGECSCEHFCNLCSFACEINVVNTGKKPMVVTSSDFVPVSAEFSFTLNVPLVKMAPRQRLEGLAVARKGVAKENAKWAVVNSVQYEYDPCNKLRHTQFWYEDDVEAEWPGLVESEMDPLGNVGDITMKVDTNEGNDLSLIINAAFDVLEAKIKALREKLVDAEVV